MEIAYNSLERKPNAKPLLNDDWSQCSCGEPNCDQVFLQKSTIVKALQPFLEKYKDLPISVNFFSAHNMTTGFMEVQVTFDQTGIIHKKDFEVIK